MRGGFFVGAAGGLALAVLVIAAASLFPQPAALQAPAATVSSVAASSTQTFAVFAPSASSTTLGGEAAAVGVPTVAGTSKTTVATTTETTTLAAGVPLATPSSAVRPQEPGSFLSVMPGEGAGSLLATLSPVVVGLLLAALVFAAYRRRQDS